MEVKIKNLAENNEQALLLTSMPGLSYYSSLLILSEIGEIERFPSAGHLCSYAGLVPSLYSSGGVIRMGKITKTGSKLVLATNSGFISHKLRGFHIGVLGPVPHRVVKGIEYIRCVALLGISPSLRCRLFALPLSF